MKNKITEKLTLAKRASKNFERLVEAAALLAVAGFTIYQNVPAHHSLDVGSVLFLVAGFIIGLRGAVEFFKHLANQ